MNYVWIVAVLLLGGISFWQYYTLRQNKKQLQQETHRNTVLQRKLADTTAKLKEVKTRRKRLLAASTQGLVIVEEDYHVSSANKVAKRLFGPLGKNDISLIEWTRQHQLLELVELVLKGKRVPVLYFSMGDLLLEAHARSIKIQGDVVAVALAINDTTELQRLSRARRDFVANISHELRTPLASIQLLLDTLLKSQVLTEQKESLSIVDRIFTQVETLNQLAQEMLDLSLIESGQIPLKLATYPLYEIVADEIKRLQPQAERKHLTLHLNIEEQAQVLVDKTMVGRVLGNLIHNAIKFTDKGEITISAQPPAGIVALNPDENDEGWIVVTVCDTGIGIPPDDLPRIFERFYKIDPARKQSGTGLGLAIAKHIIEAHGGRIWASNNPLYGVTFHCSLPVEEI